MKTNKGNTNISLIVAIIIFVAAVLAFITFRNGSVTNVSPLSNISTTTAGTNNSKENKQGTSTKVVSQTSKTNSSVNTVIGNPNLGAKNQAPKPSANPVPALAPTCLLKSDTYQYRLGDTINLTWTSENADRIVWDQGIDPSGVRKNIVAPEVMLEPNGTAPTVANVEGYQTITLQVIGPGGSAKCSTQILVAHSDAKPSIAVNALLKSSNNTTGKIPVGIVGTATNGALYNDAINLVLIDPSYTGPLDEASVYSAGMTQDPRFYSFGIQVDLRTNSFFYESWSAVGYIPSTATQVRVLAYPFYSSSKNSATQPLFNQVLTVK